MDDQPIEEQVTKTWRPMNLLPMMQRATKHPGSKSGYNHQIIGLGGNTFRAVTRARRRVHKRWPQNWDYNRQQRLAARIHANGGTT